MPVGTPVRVHPENPRYFLYCGPPRMLVCATGLVDRLVNR